MDPQSLHHTVETLSSSFSDRLLHPQSKECYCRQFLLFVALTPLKTMCFERLVLKHTPASHLPPLHLGTTTSSYSKPSLSIALKHLEQSSSYVRTLLLCCYSCAFNTLIPDILTDYLLTPCQKLSQKLLLAFYRSTVGSILAFCISLCFAGCSVADKKKLFKMSWKQQKTHWFPPNPTTPPFFVRHCKQPHSLKSQKHH